MNKYRKRKKFTEECNIKLLKDLEDLPPETTAKDRAIRINKSLPNTNIKKPTAYVNIRNND